MVVDDISTNKEYFRSEPKLKNTKYFTATLNIEYLELLKGLYYITHFKPLQIFQAIYNPVQESALRTNTCKTPKASLKSSCIPAGRGLLPDIYQ